MKTGLMLWSIHSEMEKDLVGTLSRVAEMGYEGVEFAGYFGHTTLEIRQVLDKLGLKAAGSHISYASWHDEFNKTLDASLELGLESTAVTAVPGELSSLQDFTARGMLLRDISSRIAAKGIACGYQNHDFEFRDFSGLYGMDRIMEQAKGSPLFLELEAFWAEYCSIDAATYIRKYAGRIRNLHIKDMETEGSRISTELGKGTLPLEKICRAGYETGVKWLLVKQEHYGAMNMMDAARDNLLWLRMHPDNPGMPATRN
jgi:sugar phosphate isomerase/epimerase